MYKNMAPADVCARQPHQGQQHGDSGFAEAEALRRQLLGQRDEYLRLAADFENFKKRSRKEIARKAAAQMEALVRDLLPVIDNLDRALANCSSDTTDPLRQGVEMTYRHFLHAMREHGFWPREDLGHAFDPNFHEAVSTRADPSHGHHEIAEVWQRGWMHEDKLFRPAKVVVNDLSALPEDVMDEANDLEEEELHYV